MTKNDELRETSFDREIRASLRDGRAPRAWVEDALAVPSRAVVARPARPVSLLSVLAPHLLGLVLLGSLLVALFLVPGLRAGVSEAFDLPGIPWVGEALRPVDVSALLGTLAVVTVIGLGAGGFSPLRRRR
jgi:hypothetical protein